MLIDVPASTADATQDLQIVYAAPVAAVGRRGTIDVPAPCLLLRASSSTAAPGCVGSSAQPRAAVPQGQPGAAVPQAVEVPLADLVWRLHLPSGYEVVRAAGTVASDDLRPPRPAALQLAANLYDWNADLSGIVPSGAGLRCR